MLTKEINSLQHPIVKTFVKLRTSRKFRHANQQVVICGKKQISEIGKVETLLLKKGTLPIPVAKEIFFVTDSILKKVTGLETPEPICAIVAMPKWSSLSEKHWLLALDGISDPGNLGTLIRSALALGWGGVFLTQSCVDPFNEKAIRSAKGATFSLPMQLGSKAELLFLIEQENFTPLVAEMNGTPLSKISTREKTLLILGNEARGVSEEFKNHYEKISIPIQGIESLNVAAAGSILMYNLKL